MDPDPGGPKTCGSGGSGSATLLQTRSQEVETNRNYLYSGDEVSGRGQPKRALGTGTQGPGQEVG
jgi:hypothetical protein